MDLIGRGAVVFLCIVGSGYAAWLLWDCRRHLQTQEVRRKTAVGGSSQTLPVDWLLQFGAAGTFLIVATALLVVTWPNPVDRPASDSEPDCTKQILEMPWLPPRRLYHDNDRSGRPIIAADLSNLPVTDEDVHTFLSHATEIEWLNLTRTDITDACLADVKDATEISILCMRNTSITDAGIKSLTQMQSLEDLSIRGTDITDAGLEYLQKAANLRKLDLQNTHITDAGLRTLEEFPCLEFLNVYMTRVTRDGVLRLRENRPSLQCDCDLVADVQKKPSASGATAASP